MKLADQILSTFPKLVQAPEITDDFITSNPNIMELEEVSDYFKVVPAYMLWCIKFKDEALVDLYTVNALAEYGRSKSKDNDYLSFMHRCNAEQKLAVIKFLEWCITEISTIDTKQAQRALKNWSG